MTDQFDPYYNWLAIPKHEQPPDHYRLLGVPRYEESSDVISNATDQRFHFLRTLQTGSHSAESQRLLNEVAAAAGCLLNPERKVAYDRQLRAQDAMRTPAAVAATPVFSSNTLAPDLQTPPTVLTATTVSSAKPAAQLLPNAALVAATIGVPVAMALVVVVVLSRGSGNPPDNQGAFVPPSSNSAEPPAQIPTPAQTPTTSPTPDIDLNVPPPTAAVQAQSDNPPITPSSETQPTESVPAAKATSGMDLLQAARENLTVTRGYVTRKGGIIHTTADSIAFSMPVEFPEQYVLEIDVVRESGNNGICFGFTVFGRPLTAVIDGLQRQRHRTGLASINGRETFTENNPEVKFGPLLTNGQPVTIRIEVSKEAVRLSVGQTRIVDWPYDPQAKLRSAKGMHGGDLDRLHVWTWESSFLITRLELHHTR